MNQHAILLTFSVFLLALALLIYNQTIQTSWLQNDNRTEWTTLREIHQIDNELQRNLLQLDLSGNKKTIVERGLPFSYAGDYNYLFIGQSISSNTAGLVNYFNSLNGYRIFFLEKTREQLASDLVLDLNVPRDSTWGGTASEAHFLLQPFCLQYRLSATGVRLEESTSNRCDAAANSGAINRMDFNVIFFDIREDFDQLRCNGGFCPQDSFNPANPDPYVTITFNTAACPECAFAPTSISKHVSLGSDYNIFLSCTAPTCDSEPLQLLFNDVISVQRSSAKTIRLESRFSFDQNLSSFEILDANYTIRSLDYNILRTNNIDQLN